MNREIAVGSPCKYFRPGNSNNICRLQYDTTKPDCPLKREGIATGDCKVKDAGLFNRAILLSEADALVKEESKLIGSQEATPLIEYYPKKPLR